MGSQVNKAGLLTMLFCFLMVQFGCKEEIPLVTTMNYLEAKSKWESMNLSNYQLTQRKECFCVNFGVVYRIRVENGSITSVVNLSTELPLNPPFQDFQTVEQLLSLCEWLETQQAVARFEIAYDRNTGVPTRVFVDNSAFIADDEYTYHSSLLQTSERK
ncbi:MAG: DUF6174 domain-containing protein [Chloroherpetonaceae bacterium]|nr:DUF6174 domain-containing protein [Chloroherpetonaceae bacterium]